MLENPRIIFITGSKGVQRCPSFIRNQGKLLFAFIFPALKIIYTESKKCPLIFAIYFLIFFSLSHRLLLVVSESLNYAVEAVQKFKQGNLKLTAVQKEKTSLGKKTSFNLIPF